MAHRSPQPHHLAVALAVALLATPGGARAQRSTVAPLVTAAPSARITLPEILAVAVDSTFVLLRPSLFEPRSVLHFAGGRWSAVERAFEHDSLRAVREVIGKAVALHGEGVPIGAGRVRAVRPDRCGEPPAWCPPRALIEIVGEREAQVRHLVAVNPPPTHESELVEATDDEGAAATGALLVAARAAAGLHAEVREDRLGATAVFVLEDSTRHERTLVAAGIVDSGGARPISVLVVGAGGDTLVGKALGRATALKSGAIEQLQFVSGLDLNGDGRDELLLGWQSGDEWRFEILAADRSGRWTVQWRGPDRTMPASGGRRR
ncbi:MAG TPA: hypothetical protein VMT21_06455 [Gemmatimonadales bacterium]|nr:hypothetical protein [Gemmatimonadales bacterium]